MAFRRLLYVPSVSRASLLDNDGYLEFCNLVDSLAKIGEQFYWYVLIPSWVRDGLRPFERVEYIYSDSVRDARINQTVGFPAFEIAKDFARRGGRFVIDGVLTNCIGFSGYLSYILSDPDANARVPVFVRDWGNVFDVYKDRFLDWFVLASNLVSSHVLVRSETEKRVYTKFLSRYANPSARRIFCDSTVFWPPGYSLASVRRAEDSSRTPVMFCGGEFSHLLRRSVEFDVARVLYAGGNSNIVLVTHSSMNDVKSVLPGGDSSFFSRFSVGVSRKECEAAETCGDFFVSSISEFHPLSAEQDLKRLLVGQVGIFPYCGLAVECLGDDYPFFYNYENSGEATAMAIWVSENIVEARRLIAGHVVRLAAKRGQVESSSHAWDGIGRVIDEWYCVHKIRSSRSGRKSVMQVLFEISGKLSNRFSLDVIVDILEEHIPWLKPWNKKGTLKEYGDVPSNFPTMFDLREMLDNLGWTDMCDGRDVFFEKTKDINPEVKRSMMDL